VRDALTELNRAIALCPDGAGRIRDDGNEPLAGSLSRVAASTWAAGYPDRAVDLIESAVKRSRDLNQPFSLTFALVWQTIIRAWRGEVVGARRTCEQLEALLVEQGGFATFISLNRIQQGQVASMQGEHERGIAMIRSGLADWPTLAFTYHSSILAEACLRAGRYQEAIDAAGAGREHALRTGEHFAEAEIERVAGETLLMMSVSNTAEAEQCIRSAVALTAEQDAKSFELRATYGLARLLNGQGRRDEARAMLAEIYGWFTEGFDTADLKEAKVLLDELSD
jgi:tetratricopeptide (TPR) repeat protein